MSNETDLIGLYSSRILNLAAKIPLNERLVDPHATVRKHSPICGSTVIVDIKLKNGLVVEYGQDVKACALGQAAASVLGRNIIGLSIKDIKTGLVEIRNDKDGNIGLSVGKKSFSDQNLINNFNSIIDVISKEKPSNVKGQLIKSAFITSTMGISYKLKLDKTI